MWIRFPAKKNIYTLILLSSTHLFAYNVLWDVSHGVASTDYIPSTSGGFSPGSTKSGATRGIMSALIPI